MDNLDKIIINLQEQALSADFIARHYRVLYGLYGTNQAGETLLEYQEKSAYYYEAARLLYRHRLLPQTELTPVEKEKPFDIEGFLRGQRRIETQENAAKCYASARLHYGWYKSDLEQLGEQHAIPEKWKALDMQDKAQYYYNAQSLM